MSPKHSRKRTHPKPKAMLRLPDLDQAKSGFISNLARGTINLRLGAVRPLAYEAADCGLLKEYISILRAARSLPLRLGWVRDNRFSFYPALRVTQQVHRQASTASDSAPAGASHGVRGKQCKTGWQQFVGMYDVRFKGYRRAESREAAQQAELAEIRARNAGKPRVGYLHLP